MQSWCALTWPNIRKDQLGQVIIHLFLNLIKQYLAGGVGAIALLIGKILIKNQNCNFCWHRAKRSYNYQSNKEYLHGQCV